VLETPPRAAKLETYRDPAVARRYDARWRGAAGRWRDARKARALTRALDLLEAQAGTRCATVLDVPGGTGRFAALWRARGLRQVAADLALAMLAEAGAKHAALPRVASDLARLPFGDGAFDVAVCVRFLHLVREPAERARYLRELARVARVGVIVDWRHDRTLRVWGQRLRWRLGWRPRAPANPSLAQIRAEMAAAGLRLIALLPVRRAPLLSDKVLAVATPQ
jgi:ubiquinone/menaquinone biosynthesis C-methylase UbiE